MPFDHGPQAALAERIDMQPGDLIFFVADQAKVVNEALGHLRNHLGQKLNLINEGEFNFLWVTQFPMFEYDDTGKHLQALHHPFTSPLEGDHAKLKDDPLAVNSRAYDLVLNGFEIGGGSIRIHQKAMQEKIFKALGMDKKTYGGMFKLNPRVSDLAEKFGVPGPDNTTLLVAGTVTIGGAGCMCPAGALLKALIRHLIVGSDEAFVMDLEAGIENLGRGTTRGMDALIIVVEPGQTSINTVGKIKKLAHDIGVDKIFAVGNKVMDEPDQAAIENTLKEMEIPLLTIIPFDKAVRQSNLQGQAPIDFAPSSPAVQAIKSMIPELRTRLNEEAN